MATYKVPQDVEADDKLIGPFSFRQFIYLIIVALAIALAWGLAQLFIGLAIIPLPVILLFGTLALPLRKDQPMEIYLAAMLSFYLKPRQRKWDPEGIENLIEITAPKTVEVQRTKDLSQTEAASRLSYLANIVDTQGWAIRGVAGAAGTAMNNDVYLEAQGAEDVLDTNTSVAHNFDQMMTQSTKRLREEARQRMYQATIPEPITPAPIASDPAQFAVPVYEPAMQAPVSQPPITPNPYVNPIQSYQPQPVAIPAVPQPQVQTPVSVPADTPAPHFNPYPEIHQSIVQPLNDVAHQAENDIPPVEPGATVTSKKEKQPSTSDVALTAGIMNLANNPDLSIETIAHEAHRLEKKAEESSDEVVISLR
jgi:hypothetical protein